MNQRVQAVATVQLDNDRVRVTEWRFAPGAETGYHRHELDYVVVPITSGMLRLESPEGERASALVPGQSYSRRQGTEHNVTNISGHEVAFVEIELK